MKKDKEEHEAKMESKDRHWKQQFDKISTQMVNITINNLAKTTCGKLGVK